jgi:hypothetical protein
VTAFLAFASHSTKSREKKAGDHHPPTPRSLIVAVACCLALSQSTNSVTRASYYFSYFLLSLINEKGPIFNDFSLPPFRCLFLENIMVSPADRECTTACDSFSSGCRAIFPRALSSIKSSLQTMIAARFQRNTPRHLDFRSMTWLAMGNAVRYTLHLDCLFTTSME